MRAAIAAWLQTPVFAIDRRKRDRGSLMLRAVPLTENGYQGQAPADPVGFFRVAGLVRTMLGIIVPALVLQGVFLNLLIKDRVRDALDGVTGNVVSQKEFQARKEETDRKHVDIELRMSNIDHELRERIVALEQKLRTMELDAARATTPPKVPLR